MSEATKIEGKRFIEEATGEDGRAFSVLSKFTTQTSAGYKIGEAAILEDEDDEPDCDVSIVDRRKTKAGKWEYQVKSKATDDLVRKGEWFPETSLRRS